MWVHNLGEYLLCLPLRKKDRSFKQADPTFLHEL